MSKVPDTPAIKWGRENEQNAILDLEKELNGSITNTGLEKTPLWVNNKQVLTLTLTGGGPQPL